MAAGKLMGRKLGTSGKPGLQIKGDTANKEKVSKGAQPRKRY